jgi:UDP-3-O-[3-hydroxymyristoyl] N-acetylglucosamine deacetylase
MGECFRRGTIRRRVELPPALGAISRRAVTVALEPAEIGSGLRVRRADLGRECPLDLDHVVAMPNCTAVGEGQWSVAFVEHLLAALRAALISDVLVVTDGPEIPLYDGSAQAIWAALQEAGRAESQADWEPLRIWQPLEVGEGEAVISGKPRPTPLLSYDLEHSHPLIGRQSASYGAGDDFGRELAGARTFATAEELRALYGVEPTPEMEALCVVVYPDRVSDPALPAGAFARHKLVDLLGDLYLCGRLLVGEVAAQRSGHGLNRAFLRALLEQEQTGES